MLLSNKLFREKDIRGSYSDYEKKLSAEVLLRDRFARRSITVSRRWPEDTQKKTGLPFMAMVKTVKLEEIYKAILKMSQSAMM